MRMRRIPHAKMRVKDYAWVLVVTVLVAVILKSFVLDAIHVPSHSMEMTLLDGDFVLVNKLIYGTKLPQQIPLTSAKIPFFQLPALRSIEHGDVLVFELPTTNGKVSNRKPIYFVKRCVGISGDKVSIRNGSLFINDTETTGIIQQSVSSHSSEDQFGPIVVPRKGDNIALTRENISVWDDLISHEGHRVEQTASSILIDGQIVSHYIIEKNYLFVLGDNRDHSYDSRSWGFLPEDNVIGSAMMVYWSADPRGDIRWNRIGKLVE
jgi:signal peptidase I